MSPTDITAVVAVLVTVVVAAARIRIADVRVLVADPVLTGWKPRCKIGVRRGVGTGSSESQRRLGGITAVCPNANVFLGESRSGG